MAGEKSDFDIEVDQVTSDTKIVLKTNLKVEQSPFSNSSPLKVHI
jgi:hypothetical protein